MLVKDAMVLIHLSKMTLLSASCQAFGPVLIPPRVREEVAAGRDLGYADAQVVEEAIEAGEIEVKRLDDQAPLQRLARLNVKGGEAEAVALCWQEGTDRLATDDDNVRSKQALLGVRCLGTPAILLGLFRGGTITRPKLERAIQALDRIGWFSQAVLDKVLIEVERWEAQ